MALATSYIDKVYSQYDDDVGFEISDLRHQKTDALLACTVDTQHQFIAVLKKDGYPLWKILLSDEKRAIESYAKQKRLELIWVCDEKSKVNYE